MLFNVLLHWEVKFESSYKTTEKKSLSWEIKTGCDLTFFTDITGHLNHFNSQLQGKIQLISDLFNTVRAFLAKLLLFKTQLAKGDFLHFPTCKELSPANETTRNAQSETYVAYVEKLELEFDGRFSQLKNRQANLSAIYWSFFRVTWRCWTTSTTGIN